MTNAGIRSGELCMIDYREIPDVFDYLLKKFETEKTELENNLRLEIESRLKSWSHEWGLTQKECVNLTAAFFKWMKSRSSGFSEEDAQVWLEREVDRIKKERKGGKKK